MGGSVGGKTVVGEKELGGGGGGVGGRLSEKGGGGGGGGGEECGGDCQKRGRERLSENSFKLMGFY